MVEIFGSPPPRWNFLTGDRQSVRAGEGRSLPTAPTASNLPLHKVQYKYKYKYKYKKIHSLLNGTPAPIAQMFNVLKEEEMRASEIVFKCSLHEIRKAAK